MVGITFDFGGSTFIAARQKRSCHSTNGKSSSKEECLTGNNLLGLFDVRDNLFWSLINAPAESGQRQRCAHQFQEGSTLERVIPILRLLWVFSLDQFAESRTVSQFFKAAPIFLSVRSRRHVFRFTVILLVQNVLPH